MITALWVIGIHLVEVLGVLGFLLIRKNKRLEEIIINQQQTIDAVTVLISKMDDDFKQLDGKMWVGEDEELQTIFNEMKEVQAVLSSLK
jgi:CHASE3 domain sensor protein